MSTAEQEDIQMLLSSHRDVTRRVEQLPDGVLTITTTENAALVEPLRAHVRAMSERIHRQRPVRLWDPLFRDLFARAAEVEILHEEVPGGIRATSRSGRPAVAELIKAHAAKVTNFVEQGPPAARPPWAGGRGRSFE